ncbi:MAG: gp436 family protein [Kiritimatiellales bacterium]
MSYATKQDIIDRYDEELLWVIAALRPDPDADPEEPEAQERLNEAGILKALSDATAECDCYLCERYELPLPTVPDVLCGCCVDIAVYNMATGTKLSDDIKARYDRAVKLLERIAKGAAGLGLPKKNEPQPGSGPALYTGGRNDFEDWTP